jgi:hypothetical protein
MARSHPVEIEVAFTERIGESTWDEIWHLTHKFYECERSYIEAALMRRQQIALVRDRKTRALVGMASIDIIHTSFGGRMLTALYTSHVLLLEEFRGLNLIQRVGFRSFLAVRLRHPLQPIYWFFDTFSYKSYLLLPKNFREFWPRFDQATPRPVAALIDHLATQVYGADWQPATGLVAASGRKRLREETAPVTSTLLQIADVAFFARANPNHTTGEMLVCLCPLSAKNWLSAGTRALARASGRRFARVIAPSDKQDRR